MIKGKVDENKDAEEDDDDANDQSDGISFLLPNFTSFLRIFQNLKVFKLKVKQRLTYR